MSDWTAAELKEAIERCERDTVAMIAKGERQETIDGRRKGIEMLYLWLARAEQKETRGEGQ